MSQRTEECLRELTGRLLNVQDEERRRCARELHDSAGQLLTIDRYEHEPGNGSRGVG